MGELRGMRDNVFFLAWGVASAFAFSLFLPLPPSFLSSSSRSPTLFLTFPSFCYLIVFILSKPCVRCMPTSRVCHYKSYVSCKRAFVLVTQTQEHILLMINTGMSCLAKDMDIQHALTQLRYMVYAIERNGTYIFADGYVAPSFNMHEPRWIVLWSKQKYLSGTKNDQMIISANLIGCHLPSQVIWNKSDIKLKKQTKSTHTHSNWETDTISSPFPKTALPSS